MQIQECASAFLDESTEDLDSRGQLKDDAAKLHEVPLVGKAHESRPAAVHNNMVRQSCNALPCELAKTSSYGCSRIQTMLAAAAEKGSF